MSFVILQMVLFETKHPRVKMRRLAISNLRRGKWYSTISQLSLCAISCSHSTKLNKTVRKGRGVQKWNVVYQRITKTKTERRSVFFHASLPDPSSTNKYLSTIISNSDQFSVVLSPVRSCSFLVLRPRSLSTLDSRLSTLDQHMNTFAAENLPGLKPSARTTPLAL